MGDYVELTDQGQLPAGADVDTIVQTGDERELYAARQTYDARCIAQSMLEQAGDDAARRALWESDLAELAEVSPLQALRAGQRFTDLVTGRRWITMMEAREAGASWSEIGGALGMSRQGAQDWYRRKIADQEKHLPDLHDTARARAVLTEGEERS
uniref:hypothetical protein n=1 Tax=Amycolatopsis sp. CA-151526 TaxID=3239921 RepID=UPI003F4968A2